MKTRHSFAFKPLGVSNHGQDPDPRFAMGCNAVCNRLPAESRAAHGVDFSELAPAGLKSGLRALANEAPAKADTPLQGLVNEFVGADAEGWALIPYGEHPHEEGLQLFDRGCAEEMAGYFRNTWNRIKRAVVGMPIFRGHPDLPGQAAERFPDKTVYGSIADMEVREHGLAIRPILTAEGAALVNEEGLTHFSPHWLARQVGAEGGRKVFAPAALVSIGLTNRPNIAGTSLVNSKPEIIMKDLLLKLLAALGRPLANEATDEQITAAAQEAVPAATALAARPEPTALANEQTARTTAETRLGEVQTKLAEAQTALANERKLHVAVLLDSAVADGRIAEADKPVWVSRLERDFAMEVQALANTKPGTAVKTRAATGSMGGRKEASEPAAQFQALVNEALPKHGGDWDRAWAATKATKAGKALYDQMKPGGA